MTEEHGSLEEFAEADELRGALQRLGEQLRREKNRTREQIKAIYQAAYDAALVNGTAKIPPKPKKDKRKAREEVALLHTTDWQYGKVTTSYSSEIAHRRLAEEMPDRVERLITLKRESTPVTKLYIMVGGDMIEGVMIFPGQAFSIDATLFDQLFGAANTLEQIIIRALTFVDEVHVVEEKGNHGRIGKKGEAPATDNLDLIMYRIVRERFRFEPRVVWHALPDPGIFHIFDIGAYRALLFHGDEIKNAYGNLPQFAIHKRITSWRTSWVFSDAYGGHYHTHYTTALPNGGSIFGTGSPESDNDFATEYMGAMSDPSQRLHFIDPRIGRVTDEYRLYFNYTRPTFEEN